ncbi:MAG TPA: 50S ribosomal protein L18, partial [Candidatus Hydrogenedentes bacterium]|nr:50S ribosomal protein L18 [Candidatus Hydrogenedentota bacterium]
MAKTDKKWVMLKRRITRVRKGMRGTQERPRLRVTRSTKHIYVQLIDDTTGQTLAAASSLAMKIPGGNVDSAKQVGQEIGERAKALDIRQA